MLDCGMGLATECSIYNYQIHLFETYSNKCIEEEVFVMVAFPEAIMGKGLCWAGKIIISDIALYAVIERSRFVFKENKYLWL